MGIEERGDQIDRIEVECTANCQFAVALATRAMDFQRAYSMKPTANCQFAVHQFDLPLNYFQAFASDAVRNDLSARSAQCGFDLGLAPLFAIKSHATAAARAADFGRLGARGARYLDQLIDEWRGDSGSEFTATGPLFGEDRADPVEGPGAQRFVKLQGGVANAFQPLGYARGVVNVAFVHHPVIDAGIARRARETERHTALQFVEVGHDFFSRHAFDPQPDARNPAVHRREIVLITGGDFQHLRFDVDRDERKSLRGVTPAGQFIERPTNSDVESRRPRQPGARRSHAIRADVQAGLRFKVIDEFGDERQFVIATQLFERIGLDSEVAVFRFDDEPPVVPSLQAAFRVLVNREIDRLRIVMEEVEGPQIY